MLTRLLCALFALLFLLCSLGMWLLAAAGVVLQIQGFDPGFVFMAVVATILALVAGSCSRDAWRCARDRLTY